MGWLLDWLLQTGEPALLEDDEGLTLQDSCAGADTTVMPAKTPTLPRAPRPNGTHIAQMMAVRSSALVQSDDGTWRVVRDLDDLAESDVVVRQHAWAWAGELFDAARDEAMELGTSTAQRTLLAAAGREATAELAAEYAREAALYAPRPTQPIPALPAPRPTEENN